MGSDTPPSKRVKFDYEESFDVLVGEDTDQHRFTVYNTQLCSRSGFFRKCRSKAWCAEKKKAVDLHEEDPELFSAYLTCVYTQTVPSAWPSTTSRDPTKVAKVFNIGFLAELYVLADQLQDIITANMAIDEIIRQSDVSDEIPNNDNCHFVYSNSPEGSPLRKLMVDYEVHESNGGIVEGENTTPEFILDIAREFTKIRSSSNRARLGDALGVLASERAKCYYHQHDEEHPVCK